MNNLIKVPFINSMFTLAPCLLIVMLTFTACNAQIPFLSASGQPSPQPVIAPAPGAPAVQNSYADTVNRVSPAVVTVRSIEQARSGQQFPFFSDPFFRDFFGDRAPSPQQPQPRRQGLGSGVIVSSDGYILTNHHVVDGALEIRIELTDNRTYSAKLVGSDPPSDLAVLKVDTNDLPVLSLGNSDQVRVGDVVLAIGNPLGIGQTVTSGIISAKGRSTGLSDGSFEDFLQTDAAINRGNSGGALVNTSGELIGINSQILSPSGGNIGIGFAIPSNMARAVMDQLLKEGRVRRGMLGVNIQSINADLAASLNLPAARGAIVTGVQPGSAAEKADIRRGDVITALNNQPVLDGNSLRNAVASTPPGTQVTLTVLRDAREQQIRATLGELPAGDRAAGQQTPGEGTTGSSRFGLTLEPLTPAMASRLEISGEQGLIVTRVEATGPAANAGIRQGDVIQEVNRQPVKTVAEFDSAMQRSGARPALLLVNRRGTVTYLTLRPA